MKILCPVDFSATSVNAVEFAAQIAQKHNGSLTILHTFSKDALKKFLEKENRTIMLERSHADLASYTLHILKEMAETVSKTYENVSCNYYFIEGETEDKIVEFANEFQLVVMGTDGVADIFERMVGSLTLQVTEQIECPIICIPNDASFNNFGKVFYASDYQEEDKEAIKKLITITEPFHSKISIFHIFKKDTSIEEANYQSYIEEMKSYFPHRQLDYVDVQTDESIYLGIHHYMLENGGDLLGLFHHSRNFFQKLFEKSTTKEVTYAANYPVIIFK